MATRWRWNAPYLVDLALLGTTVLLWTTPYTVALFHLIFVLLAVGAFFWEVRPFVVRSVTWVGITSLEVSLDVWSGTTQVDELIEIPVLSAILLSVFLISGRRARANAELTRTSRSLAVANAELDRVADHYRGLYRSAMGALTRAQEDERKRVARELHDGLGQALTAVTLALDAAEAAIAAGRSGEAAVALREARRGSAETLARARELVNDLRPAHLDEGGLVLALERRARRLLPEAELGIRADGYARGVLGPLEEAELYRCAVEALVNVARHASARAVSIDLGVSGGIVRAAIRDDGRGFDPAAPHDGLGLVGMHERAVLLGGQIWIRSRPNEGTEVVIEIPRGASAPLGVG